MLKPTYKLTLKKCKSNYIARMKRFDTVVAIISVVCYDIQDVGNDI